jgi:hypothetical protein
MTQLPESERGQAVAKRGLTSLDLLVVARDLRSQWFAFAFARLSTPVARLGSAQVARPRPQMPAAPARFGFFRPSA